MRGEGAMRDARDPGVLLIGEEVKVCEKREREIRAAQLAPAVRPHWRCAELMCRSQSLKSCFGSEMSDNGNGKRLSGSVGEDGGVV